MLIVNNYVACKQFLAWHQSWAKVWNLTLIFKTSQMRFLHIHSAAISFTKICFYWSLKSTGHSLVAFSILKLPVNTGPWTLLSCTQEEQGSEWGLMLSHCILITELAFKTLTVSFSHLRLLFTLASMTVAHITAKGSSDQGKDDGDNIEMFFH